MIRLWKTNLTIIFLSIGQCFSLAQELPIMAFHGIQEKYTSRMNFKNLKETGINLNLTIYNTSDEAQKALDVALQEGVKILLYVEELVNYPEEMVRRFKNHPALFGYYIYDEPDTSNFEIVKNRIDGIRKYDTIHPCYVNLFPNYAGEYLKANNYEDYLTKYVSSVPIDFISFDNYPLMNNEIHPDWYQNLEMIRNASILSKKSFWGFANSTVFGVYKQPTTAGIKLQMYSNLLYGAQGIQYFTYWTLNDDYWKEHNFGQAMVNSEGIPTSTYDVVKNVNKDIKKHSKVFYGSTVTSVYHTKKNLPNFTKLLPNKPQKFKIFSTDKPALVSYIKNGKENYIVVLNKDINYDMKLIVKPKSALNILDRNGNNKNISTRKNSFIIRPGDIMVFNY